MQAISLDTSKSTQASTAKKRSAPLDPQVADRLLDLLSSDDAFRKLFSRDPREALAQVGFVNTTDLPSPADCKVWPLASKSQIAAAREEIKKMFTSGLNQTTPDLDASLSRNYRRK
jgi:putative modified peptide